MRQRTCSSASDPAQSRVIMTTDADGRVGTRWISANLAAIAAGADLVAGFVRADRGRACTIAHRGDSSAGNWRAATNGCWPSCSHELDLEAHDPWPRHRIASGASLALTLAAYRRVGGLTPIAAGEDRALANSINLIGGRTRHCLAAQVVVSCRLDGRAAGGMAATIRQRALIPDLACDPALEPAANLVRRARWRAALRRRHQQGGSAGGRALGGHAPAQPIGIEWRHGHEPFRPRMGGNRAGEPGSRLSSPLAPRAARTDRPRRASGDGATSRTGAARAVAIRRSDRTRPDPAARPA